MFHVMFDSYPGPARPVLYASTRLLRTSLQPKESTMSTAPRSVTTHSPKWMIWTGRVLSAIPVLLFFFGGALSFSGSPQVTEGMAKFGYPADLARVVAALEIGSAVLYLIPPTAVLGALFMTAYLGAAVATHLRVHDPGWPMAIVTAIFVWGGLWLRDRRLRELLPLRKTF